MLLGAYKFRWRGPPVSSAMSVRTCITSDRPAASFLSRSEGDGFVQELADARIYNANEEQGLPAVAPASSAVVPMLRKSLMMHASPGISFLPRQRPHWASFHPSRPW